MQRGTRSGAAGSLVGRSEIVGERWSMDKFVDWFPFAVVGALSVYARCWWLADAFVGETAPRLPARDNQSTSVVAPVLALDLRRGRGSGAKIAAWEPSTHGRRAGPLGNARPDAVVHSASPALLPLPAAGTCPLALVRRCRRVPATLAFRASIRLMTGRDSGSGTRPVPCLHQRPVTSR
jgi:hypothetical protein